MVDEFSHGLLFSSFRDSWMLKNQAVDTFLRKKQSRLHKTPAPNISELHVARIPENVNGVGDDPSAKECAMARSW
ncbi:MAG: hypothetical protein ABJH45_16015 [Paracoccaceae bacterium]